MKKKFLSFGILIITLTFITPLSLQAQDFTSTETLAQYAAESTFQVFVKAQLANTRWVEREYSIRARTEQEARERAVIQFKKDLPTGSGAAIKEGTLSVYARLIKSPY